MMSTEPTLVSTRIALVGDIGEPHDPGFKADADDVLRSYYPDYFPSIAITDSIDLNRGRDFLAETRDYDIVILQYVFGMDQGHRSGPFATSPNHSPERWRDRLVATGADFIFAYGGWTEVAGQYLGEISGYKHHDLQRGWVYVKEALWRPLPTP